MRSWQEINAKLSLVDNIAMAIDEELERCETLRQSILKRAFSGYLVEQNPSDEPASVLLERIKVEKADHGMKVKMSKKGMVAA